MKQNDIVRDFYSWIQGLAPHRYQYIVVMSRRAASLVDIIRGEYEDVLPNYITENALLLLAEDLSDFFQDNHAFPQIAIVDDILVYGRSLNLALSRLWNTICQYLSRAGISTERGGEAEQAFLQSIHPWVYAVNDAPILLRHEFQTNLRNRKSLPETELRVLARDIIKCVIAGDTSSTSCAITAKLPSGTKLHQPNPQMWAVSREPQYRNDASYSFYLFSAAQGIYPCVRSYKRHGSIYFSPDILLSGLTWKQMIRILETAFAISSQQNLEATNACIRLLNRIKDPSSRMIVYAQFAVLLLSQATLSVFLDSKVKPVYDVDKVARNFGPVDEIAPILQCFCSISWNEEHLTELFGASNQPAGQIVPLDAVEVAVYEQAVAHKRDAAEVKQHVHRDIEENPIINRIGEQNLDQFLDRTQISASPAVLSCLAQMADSGDLSIHTRYKHNNGDPVFYSSIRTTVLSLAILPRKLSAYYSCFSLLTRLYWRDDDFPERVERYFRDEIFSGVPNLENARMISHARLLAQLMAENRIIAGSMLNWEEVLLEDSERNA